MAVAVKAVAPQGLKPLIALDGKWTSDPFDRRNLANGNRLAWLISADGNVRGHHPRTEC